jgi:hypothetical protein
VGLSKELLGLAGEYAVASELCRRGIYAQLTLGNHKRTDLLVETQERLARIQVKAKQGGEWPAVSGIHTPGDFLVLVDFSDSDGGPPEFFVLDQECWKELVRKDMDRHPGAEVDDELNIRYADGWKGLNIRKAAVAANKDRWDKITEEMQ